MRQRRLLGPFCLVFVAVLACSRPAENSDGAVDTLGGSGGRIIGGSGGIKADGGGVGGKEEVIGGSGGSGQDAAADAAGSGGSVTKTSCTDPTYADDFVKPYVPGAEETQASSKVSQMTVPDMASQMRGTVVPGTNRWANAFQTQDSNNGGILQLKFRDGPRGVNMLCEKKGSNGYSTAFPVAMARGASFDMELEERIGEAMGDETVASKNTILLAPVVEALRHPAWGRAQETYGEDPYHLGRMGAAMTIGVQKYVPACAKHYAANNIEKQRSSANAVMDEQTLREIYARPYEFLVKDAGIACVMAAYNKINGTKCTQNKHLLKEILRLDFGFNGFTLTDWDAMPTGSASYAGQALDATLDVEMPHQDNYVQLETLATASSSNANLIKDAAKRILQQKYRFNIASPSGAIGLKPASTTLTTSTWSIDNNESHIDLAYEAALKSMVLLKNESSTLPIKSTVKKVAVIGASVPYKCQNTDYATGTVSFAKDKVPRLGDLGSSRVAADPAKSIGMSDGIKQVAAELGSNIVVSDGTTAADVPADADFVVVVAGLTPQDEGEEYTNGTGDRPNFGLDPSNGGTIQNNLIAAVAALGKPMVVVLEGGSVISTPWLNSVPALVMAWYPGQVGGLALGRLLFGQANFSGKLPITWPAAWTDEPAFPFSTGLETSMDYYVGYRYFEKYAKSPLFPFGHGLSYTTFQYSNLQVPCSDVTADGVINIKVDVTNTGSVAGDEVVFVFTSYPTGSERMQVKQLKAFYRVSLEAAGEYGSAKRITIPLRVDDLKRWDDTTNDWLVEKGTLKIMVGSSSTNLPQSDTVTIK